MERQFECPGGRTDVQDPKIQRDPSKFMCMRLKTPPTCGPHNTKRDFERPTDPRHTPSKKTSLHRTWKRQLASAARALTRGGLSSSRSCEARCRRHHCQSKSPLNGSSRSQQIRDGAHHPMPSTSNDSGLVFRPAWLPSGLKLSNKMVAKLQSRRLLRGVKTEPSLRLEFCGPLIGPSVARFMADRP